MINLPYNAASMSQIMPGQNVPVQTSQNNFQSFQQPQTATQQMQTSPYTICPGNLQEPYKQGPFYQLYQPETFTGTHHHISNASPTRSPCQPIFQTPYNVPPMVQSQPKYGFRPQNLLEQVPTCTGNAAPIFILPNNCHQSPSHQQPTMCATNQVGGSQAGQSTSFNYPPVCYPPSFYPYPIPLPIYQSFGTQIRPKEFSRDCECCQKRRGNLEFKSHTLNCCYNGEEEEHRCTATNDDTICSRRNCPSSISLQALASQFLSLPGIVSCAATRLILRKIPGSNITSTMDDTMYRAQKSISVLTKEQLLVESRNAQQVNALINLHMTTNPPANIIPILTLLQLKVNLLKAQVESLINKKVMECQGYGVEVETTGAIDAAILALKTDAELRELLTALRQKECDERINLNFSPYHSQRAIAEMRLSNVQTKIRQVENEFDKRRSITLTTPTHTSRVVQQFAESYCSFGFARSKFFEPTIHHENYYESPHPFTMQIQNPRRLYLKPHVGSPATTYDLSKATNTSEDVPKTSGDKETEDRNDCTKERNETQRSSTENCSCIDETTSEESLDEAKKKLRLTVDPMRNVQITSAAKRCNESFIELVPNDAAEIDVQRITTNKEGNRINVCEIPRSLCMEIIPENGLIKQTDILTYNSTAEMVDKAESLVLKGTEASRIEMTCVKEECQRREIEKDTKPKIHESESDGNEGSIEDSNLGKSYLVEIKWDQLKTECFESEVQREEKEISVKSETFQIAKFDVEKESEFNVHDRLGLQYREVKKVEIEGENIHNTISMKREKKQTEVERPGNSEVTINGEAESESKNIKPVTEKEEAKMETFDEEKVEIKIDGSDTDDKTRLEFEETKKVKMKTKPLIEKEESTVTEESNNIQSDMKTESNFVASQEKLQFEQKKVRKRKEENIEGTEMGSQDNESKNAGSTVIEVKTDTTNHEDGAAEDKRKEDSKKLEGIQDKTEIEITDASSSNLYKSTFEITLRPTKRKVLRKQEDVNK